MSEGGGTRPSGQLGAGGTAQTCTTIYYHYSESQALTKEELPGARRVLPVAASQAATTANSASTTGWEILRWLTRNDIPPPYRRGMDRSLSSEDVERLTVKSKVLSLKMQGAESGIILSARQQV